MFETPFSKLTVVLSIFLSLIVVTFIFISDSKNSITALVFCDVGQGDGIYLRIKNQTDILVDAGPSRKILDCLGKNMPFYDRSIELAIISHGQKDHFGGFLYILDRYDVKKFWMSEAYNPSESFKELLDKIDTKDILIEFPKAGETSTFSDAKIEFFWPSDDFILKNTFEKNTTHSLFRRTFRNLNDFSLIFKFELETENILFTGDASPNALNNLLQPPNIRTNILKIPHHGSKNGLNPEFLKLADPTYGVISAGKNNSYGHPHKIILDILKAQKVKIKRTDLDGDIVFTFD